MSRTAARNTSSTAVIFVHGLWMNGLELSLLRRRVEQAGYRTAQFVYSTVQKNVAANAEALFHFARGFGCEQLHFVGYSLGGLVTVDMLSRFGDRLPDGRVVLIGSPVRGSAAARNLSERQWARRALGASIDAGLLDDHAAPWHAGREFGVIAGTRALGLGGLWGELARPNDGTVAVEETRLPIEADRLELPLTHFTLMLSRRVARACCNFLRSGAFREISGTVSGENG